MGINKLTFFNTKKIIIYLYVYLPVLFYFPLFYMTNKLGSITINFYNSLSVVPKTSIILLVGHLVLGGMVIFFIKSTNYTIHLYKAPNSINALYVILYFLYCFILKISYIQILLFPLLIIIVAHYRLSRVAYSLLVIISVLQMEINEDRYMLIFSLILWLLPFLCRQNVIRLIVMTVFTLFMLIFILQPMRYGHLPFSNISSLGESVLSVFYHLQPIYIAAVLGTSLDLSVKSLIIEFIPFAKSVTGDVGVVEKISQDVLPDYILNRGTRLGSNSSAYFSYLGIGIVGTVLLFLNRVIYFLNLRLLKQSILLYFIFNGPYFFRRSIGSYIIDVIIIVFIVIFISLILQLRKKKLATVYDS